MKKFFCARALLLAAGISCVAALSAQSAWQPPHQGIGFGQSPSKQWVQMVSSPELAVQSSKQPGATAKQPKQVELRFDIQSGLHINSHSPKSHFLIPTALTFDAPAGVEIAKVEYPEGVDYRFAFAPNDSLSVYTGEFAVMVQLRAKPGRYTVHGQLKYQACDNRACNPPKTLPLTLDVTAR